MVKSKVSVIIPVWNGIKYLPDCLDALLAQDYPDFEVITVDNASMDGSADFIAENYPQVRLMRNERNLGFAGGCNVGLRVAEGDVLVLLNQDTQVQPGWLLALRQATVHESQIGAVGCKILYPDKKTIQHAGGWIEWPLGLAHHYGQGEPDAGQWDDSHTVDYVTGAAIAFRREILDEVGLLDEAFYPGYFEDADLCFRIREAGYEIWYAPDAVLIHQETTCLTDPAIISQAYQRGRLRFLLKHLSPQRFLTEFVPAEEEYQLPAIRGRESAPLRLAYLEAIPMVAGLFHQRRVDQDVISEVLMALQRLYRRVGEEDWHRVEDLVAANMSTFPVIEPSHAASVEQTDRKLVIPQLREFEFHSTLPVVGFFLARFRSLWYNVAARWAMRHLIWQINQQQEAINQQQEVYVQFVRQQVMTLTEENALLAREIARLVMQVDINSMER